MKQSALRKAAAPSQGIAAGLASMVAGSVSALPGAAEALTHPQQQQQQQQPQEASLVSSKAMRRSNSLVQTADI
jgi:hypothetical protein